MNKHDSDGGDLGRFIFINGRLCSDSDAFNHLKFFMGSLERIFVLLFQRN
jgi:hypothetical protein